jgi:hypothetical protein
MDGQHVTADSKAGIDGPGRQKPEIVAPGNATSWSTPVISAACGMMIELANTDGLLAANPNADRSEVIKSAILAGARHRDGWTNNPDTSGPERGVTDRPLDDVYGVDLLNVDRTHLIMTGGEQDGADDVPTAKNAGPTGWDLVTIDLDDSKYWRFAVGELADEVSILTTWHRWSSDNFASWALADLDLILWRVDDQDQLQTLVGDPGLPYFAGGNVVSESSVNNIEHLYVTGLEPGDYVLELRRVDSINNFPTWDAAVAWIMPGEDCIPADVNCDGFVNVDDLFAVLNAWGVCDGCPEDINDDGFVNVDDLFEVLNNWG